MLSAFLGRQHHLQKRISFPFTQIKDVNISKQGGTENEDEKIFCP